MRRHLTNEERETIRQKILDSLFRVGKTVPERFAEIAAKREAQNETQKGKTDAR